MLEPERPITEGDDRRGIVGDENDRPSLLAELPHPAETSLLEERIADRQRLVDDQNVRIRVDRGAESEPQGHSRGVALHRALEGFTEAAEFANLRHTGRRVATGMTRQHAEQERILGAGELRIDAR